MPFKDFEDPVASPRKSKKSEQLSIIAFAIAAAVTTGLYWFLPSLPWWAYLLVFLISIGAGYSQLLKDAANESIVDRR